MYKDNISQLKTNCVNITYFSFFIASILFYVESILVLLLTFEIASKHGSTGLGTFVIWSYHFIAMIVLIIIGSILFLIELCLHKLIHYSINIALSKKVCTIFLAGFVFPVLLVFIIPIISIGFDIKLGYVGTGKLFPYQPQVNSFLENKNIGVSQKELKEITPKNYKSYGEIKDEKTGQNKYIPKARTDFYNEQITRNETKKSINNTSYTKTKITLISQTKLNQIAQKWYPPLTDTYKDVTVKVEISGAQILSKTIIKSSKDIEFDNSVKNAIDAIIPILENSEKGVYGLTFVAGPNLKEISNNSSFMSSNTNIVK